MRNGITARDVMNREFIGVSESDTLADAGELMVEEGADSLVVLRGREPVGSLSARDALAAMLEGDPYELRVGEIMRPSVPTVTPDARLVDAESRLASREVDHVLVIEGNDAVGLITKQDLLAASGGLEEQPRDELTLAGEMEGSDFEHSQADADESLTQSICEVCGSLTSELSSANGQLVCPDCRDF